MDPQEVADGLRRQLDATRAEISTLKIEAQHAALSKAQFLARMNHELRTPLNAVLGFSELIAAMGRDASLDQARSYAESIVEGGRQLERILRDVLEMARIEAGKIDLEIAPVPVATLLGSVMQLVRRDAEQRGVRLDCEPAPDMRLMVDESALRRALVHVVGNAVKFTRRDGHVHIGARFDSGRGFVFSITDTGIGMDPGLVEHLMQPFTQADERLSREYEGAGLGLPLARGLVEIHDGSLEVETRLGVGTRIEVILPRYRVEGGTAPDEATIVDFDTQPQAPFSHRLVLSFEGRDITMFAGSGTVLLGRNRDKPNEVRCDVVVDDPRVSRPHARIRFEQGGFILTDHSQRGTYVVQGGRTAFLRQDGHLMLQGEGAIYLGVDPSNREMSPVRYHHVVESAG
ncbi:ATP-binding protein [Zavarzinia sp. CC-PAN008]|uniref:ATP-binding protein n=1 Tax=Zavarzinia sp. CC-PAN008 TaxID=3243332 RepID=UPI003F745FDD